MLVRPTWDFTFLWAYRRSIDWLLFLCVIFFFSWHLLLVKIGKRNSDVFKAPEMFWNLTFEIWSLHMLSKVDFYKKNTSKQFSWIVKCHEILGALITPETNLKKAWKIGSVFLFQFSHNFWPEQKMFLLPFDDGLRKCDQPQAIFSFFFLSHCHRRIIHLSLWQNKRQTTCSKYYFKEIWK